MFNLNCRKISNVYHLIIFAISLIAVFFANDSINSIFNFDFNFKQLNIYYIVIFNFIMVTFNIVSKDSINKEQKYFYFLSVLFSFLINSVILIDNIFIIFISLFATFFISYLLNKSKEQLLYNCMMLFCVLALISYGLLRYFALNDVAFTFSNLALNQNKISESALNLAFFGFFIIISWLFNFIPFNLKKNNCLISGIYAVAYYILAGNLIIKLLPVFSDCIYKNQKIIICYLLLNAIYFAFIQFKSRGLSDFLQHTMSANAAISLFGIFVFSESGLISFVYYTFCVILTYIAGFILCDLIIKNMGSDNFSNLKKILHKEFIIKIFVFIIILNIAKAPIGVGFSSFIYSFINIFLLEDNGLISVLSPYILFVCTFLISLNGVNVLANILSKPTTTLKNFKITTKQWFSLCICSILIIGFGVCIQYIINQLAEIADIGVF